MTVLDPVGGAAVHHPLPMARAGQFLVETSLPFKSLCHMKLKLAHGLLAPVAGLVMAVTSSSTQLMPANSSAVIYEGRFATEPSGAVQLGFPGVTAHLRFRGKGLIMRARAPNDEVAFDVSVDGADFTLLRLHGGEGDYSLIQGENIAEHTVTIVRRNESWQGTCEIKGFDPGAGGELLAPSALPPRKLMFIGDSVTCGEMTAFQPGREMHDKMNSNARVSYGMILARRLGAQCHLVSYGGRGIIRDWQGIRDIRNAPQFYELALPDDPTVPWEHARYVPEAIGLELGTNDFSPGVPDQNEFVNAYVEFIRKVRRDAPGALIFIMDSPIVDDDPIRGPRRTVLHAYLEQVVTRVRNPQVVLAPLRHYPGVPGNGHPTGQDHLAIAAELEPVLHRALGW